MLKTPLRAIRAHCLECCCEQGKVVADCPCNRTDGPECSLWPFRLGRGRPKLQSIRQKCLDCSAYNFKEVRECKHVNCNLWPYRMGRNPKLAGKGNIGSLLKGSQDKKTPTGMRVLSL